MKERQGRKRGLGLLTGVRADEGANTNLIHAGHQHPIDDPVSPKVGDQFRQGMRTVQLSLAIGSEEEQAGLPMGADDVFQQQKRRLVRPVEVVEDKHERVRLRGLGEQQRDTLEKAVAFRLRFAGGRR